MSETPPAGSAWDPAQYGRFRAERAQPFYDLLALVQPIPGGRAIDLGCGTGDLTRVLHDRTGALSTLGLDNSETMLAEAKSAAGRGVTFRLGTIARFAPRRPFDLVFSNAALQWLPDHAGLFPRLAAGVAAGGQVAVQMPANHGHVSHRLAQEIAAEQPFRDELGGYARAVSVMPPEWYAETLDGLGFVEQHVRLQVYAHHLASRDEIAEWVRGTFLTDYQQRLSPESFGAYLERYRARLAGELPDRRPFLYPFKRILLWGRKAEAGD